MHDDRSTSGVAALIRDLRTRAGLTQQQLAERIGTTQSVISRLERDDYEGHSFSMLYRIGAALGRRVEVVAVEDTGVVGVHERGVSYRASGEGAALTTDALALLIDLLEHEFGERGVTREAIVELVGRARTATARRTLDRLRGVVELGPGDVVADVRSARRRRGAEVEAG